jgi:pyruvate ferredoxin oxidoreductase alpha subunit
MVCMDGFILTHAVEGIDVPEQRDIDAFLPAYEPRQVLDPAHPISIGAMVGPEAFTEVRYLSHLRQLDALELIPALASQFASAFGRDSGGLIHSYRTLDAATIVVAMGSVLGTIKDAVDRRCEMGDRVGVVGITTFRPFPFDEVRRALSNAQQVIVVEKAFSVGYGGVLSTDVATATHDTNISLRTVVAGLGGRAITQDSLEAMLDDAAHDRLSPVTFLDLDLEIVELERDRISAQRRSGPSAENVLSDLGTVASRIG